MPSTSRGGDKTAPSEHPADHPVVGAIYRPDRPNTEPADLNKEHSDVAWPKIRIIKNDPINE